MNPPSLRERKAAQTRLAIADAIANALATLSLAEVRVEDVAEKASISRMTFFNYFPTKEAAVTWGYAAWLFRLQVELHRDGLSGVPALLRIARHFADSLADRPGTLPRYLSSREATLSLGQHVQLDDADRYVIAPDLAATVPVETYGQILTRLVYEGRQRGELEFEGSPFEFALFLGAAMQGSAFVGRIERGEELGNLVMRHVHRALGLPLDDAAPPPSVPAAYRYPPTPERSEE